ncbi:MAG: thioredoxin [Anaeroplasma sp.]
MVEHIVSNSFKDFINNDEIVIVDFWASWCGPCRMLAPILEEVNSKNNIKIGKVNVDEEADLAEAFSIYSIPTLLAFKSGKLVGRSEGYKSYDMLMKWINEIKK